MRGPTTDEIKRDYSDKYKQHIAAIFRNKLDNGYSTDDEEIAFDRDDIDRAEKRHGLARINNTADLPYNLRGRANLPDELGHYGYDSVIRNIEIERKDAAYLITKRQQIIDLPPADDIHHVDVSGVPGLVQSFTSHDEQGVLTLARYLNIIHRFLDLDECHHLQDHLQTSGPAGQAEIDGLYIGAINGINQVVLVEGKDEDEEFTRNQLALNALTLRRKDKLPDDVITVGVKPHGGDVFSVTRFDVPESRDKGTVEIERTKYYSFSQRDLSQFENSK